MRFVHLGLSLAGDVFGGDPRSVEAVGHARGNDDAEKAWTKEVVEVAEYSLMATTKTWFFGNNIPGKKRFFLGYFGGFTAYIEKCDEVAAAGYKGFEFE